MNETPISPGADAEWVTIEEAAELCGVKRRTVNQWLRLEKITKFRADNGYHVRLNKAEVQSFNHARQQKYGMRVSDVAPGAG